MTQYFNWDDGSKPPAWQGLVAVLVIGTFPGVLIAFAELVSWLA